METPLQMDIVEEIRRNRENGARRLEAEYRDRLMAFACKLCPDRMEAQSFVNQAFAEAVDKIDSLNRPESFFGWLCGIVVNCRNMSMRRKERSGVTYTDEVPEAPVDGAAQVVSAVDAAILHDAIAGLPAHLRESLMLRYFMDLPLSKIAKILALPAGTVKSRLYYARVMLAQRLGAAMKNRKSAVVALAAAAFLFAAAAATVATGAWNAAEDGGMADAAEAVRTERPDDAQRADGADGAGPEISETSTNTGDSTMNGKLSKWCSKLRTAFLPVLAVAGAMEAAAAEDPYIESDGTAFINSRWFMNPQGIIEVDYALTSTSLTTDWNYIFGACNRSSSSEIGTRAGLFVNSNGRFLVGGDAPSKTK